MGLTMLKEVAELAAKHPTLRILQHMQYLYDSSFGKWYSWDEDDADKMQLYPPAPDPAHLNGASLIAAGRSHAQALWEASQTETVHAVVLEGSGQAPKHYDVNVTQVVAVVMNVKKKLVVEDAEHGAGALFSSGVELQRRLQAAGVLKKFSVPSNTKQKYLGTQVRRVNAVFNDIAYVIISSDASIFRACARGAACTCKWFCRHAGCEHVEYVSMLALRLQKQPKYPNPQELPGTRPRGRKRGSHLVVPQQTTGKKKRKVR